MRIGGAIFGCSPAPKGDHDQTLKHEKGLGGALLTTNPQKFDGTSAGVVLGSCGVAGRRNARPFAFLDSHDQIQID